MCSWYMVKTKLAQSFMHIIRTNEKRKTSILAYKSIKNHISAEQKETDQFPYCSIMRNTHSMLVGCICIQKKRNLFYNALEVFSKLCQWTVLNWFSVSWENALSLSLSYDWYKTIGLHLHFAALREMCQWT